LSPATQCTSSTSEYVAWSKCCTKYCADNFSSKFRDHPPPPVLATVINDYFSYCHNKPYSLFHEQTFRERLERNEIPEFLLLVLVASGVRYTTHPFFKGDQTIAIEQYSNRSWALVVQRWYAIEEETDLDVVRAMLLHSVVDFTGLLTSLSFVPSSTRSIIDALTLNRREASPRLDKDWPYSSYITRSRLNGRTKYMLDSHREGRTTAHLLVYVHTVNSSNLHFEMVIGYF
jgi:hypothetical protein